MQTVYPATSDPLDVQAAMNAQDELMWSFLDLSIKGSYSHHFTHYLKQHGWYPEMREEDRRYLKNHPDFIGVNYYASLTVRAKRDDDDTSHMPPFFISDQFYVMQNPKLKPTEWMHSGIDPEGLYLGMRAVYDRYHLPMIITENGMAYSDILEDGAIHDEYRIDYLKKHLVQVTRLIAEGYPVLGYCPWSFVDVVSTHEGFGKRYGLVYVNRTNTDLKDCKRIKKDSFYWYQKVITNNGLS
jgi:6-phospho-beta-glucosidase